MRETNEISSWRWLAAVSAVSGFLALMLLAVRGQASMSAVVPSSAMFIGGAVLFARMTTRPDRWARAMMGPEARRFFAVCVASLLIVLVAVFLLALDFLGALPI